MNNVIEIVIQDSVAEQLRHTPNANADILRFIFQFIYHNADPTAPEVQAEYIRKLFRAGYCYYFAKMLEDAYPGGLIAWAAPYGHITYLYDGVPYDINGVCNIKNVDCFIPISRLGRGIDDFRHIPNVAYNITDQEMAQIILQYKESEYASDTILYQQKRQIDTQATCKQAIIAKILHYIETRLQRIPQPYCATEHIVLLENYHKNAWYLGELQADDSCVRYDEEPIITKNDADSYGINMHHIANYFGIKVYHRKMV